MSFDEQVNEINNAFEKKINNLGDSIKFFQSNAGSEPPKGATVAFFAATAINIKDLYEMFQSAMNLMVAFRRQFDVMSSKTENLDSAVNDLKQKYDGTLGSLNNRLKKINDADEERKNRGQHYG